MAAAADKFARVAALKPARPMPARPAAIRTPGEEDALSRLLGGNFQHGLVEARLANRELRRVHAHREAAAAGVQVIARERALAALVELATRI